MTETKVKFSELQQSIAHLTDVTEAGWVLKWGDTPETSLELVCRKANTLQMQRLDALVSEGHRRALANTRG